MVFTRSDAQTFFERLRAQFPVVAIEQPRLTGWERKQAPLIVNNLRLIDSSKHAAYLHILSEGWPTVLADSVDYTANWFHLLTRIRVRWAEPERFDLRGRHALPDPLHIPGDDMSVSYRPGEDRIKNQVMRAIAAVCEPSRVDVMWPSLAPAGRIPGDTWIGRDAAQWCRQGIGRVLGLRHILDGPLASLPEDLVRRPDGGTPKGGTSPK